MRPRTVIIALFVLLGSAFLFRVSLVWSGAIPGEHDDLKQAEKLVLADGNPWVGFSAWSPSGTARVGIVTVSDPDEVREILATLRIKDSGKRRRYYSPKSGGNDDLSVEFHLPGGRMIQATFSSPTELNRWDRGTVTVDRAFHDKVRAILQARGRKGNGTDPPRPVREIDKTDK
jgi:hypothetical protein